MLNILKYQHDRITGAVDMAISFQLKDKGNVVQENKNFTTELNAQSWFADVKKNYLLHRFDNFVYSCAMELEKATGHKSLHAKQEALTTVRNYAQWAATMASLTDSCRYMLLIKDSIEKILPFETNEQYPALYTEQSNLIAFARKHVDHGLLSC